MLSATDQPTWVAILGVVIAFVALAQPWIYALWRKFYRPGFVEVLIAGMPEIGFSDWGPTIGLEGALVARNRDFVVEDISITCCFKETDAKHEFVWAAFKPSKLRIGSDDPIELELPVGFIASQSQPHRFNIFFQDKATSDKIAEPLRDLEEKFGRLLEQHKVIGPDSFPAETPEHEAAQVAFRQAWEASGYKVDAHTAISDAFYWKPGKYTATIRVLCRWPKREFSCEFDFDLTTKDCERVKLNIIALTALGRIVDGADIDYNFAYPERSDVVQK